MHPRARQRRTSSASSRLLAFLLLVLLAGPGLAYTVFLKDGSTIVATREFEVRDGYVVIETASGAVTRVRVEEVDVERTRAYNESNYGSAVVIDGRSNRPLERGEAEPQTLDELLRQRELSTQQVDRGRVPRTPAGYPDLMALRRQSLDDPTAEAVRTALRSQGIEDAEIHRGTADGRVLVELPAEEEEAVFEALVRVARAYRSELSSRVDAIELLMVGRRRARSGQFELTSDNTRELVAGEISPADFFLEYVQF